MTLNAPEPQPTGYWSQQVALAGVERDAERRRFQVAALVTILVHLLLFAVRIPIEKALAIEPPTVVRVPLSNFRPTPPKSEPLPPEAPTPEPVRATIQVPGPPEPEIMVPERLEPIPIPTPSFALSEPTPVPVEAPPLPEVGPVVFDPSSIERPLRVYSPTPRYTEMARKIRRQGTMIVEATIETSGLVSELRVIRGLGAGLDEAALDTVRTWRFEPATRHGEPIAVIYNLTIRFQLQ